ncbi:hypothetical protein LTR37_012652 [Vermiconidia calcicola]|uniref:Uncharacterized protein n=1 Tax=Vermiconidia calcicola TaxID=1690605 RepID=A0ACC3MZ23_9PEZI|nr:hypothetical protein LTR37_012652 [Vermiconidia calcicola]
MPKERSVNPAQQQRKADKQKEIAKSKKQLQGQRNEKLARRNPERLQKQIDELKELEQRGALRPKDQETLKQLERDVKGVKRAREALGDAAPKFPERRSDGRAGGMSTREEQIQRRQNQQQHLGKRRRGDEDAQSGSDTDPEVRDIPMPRDTPPPIPRAPRAKFVDPQIGPDGKRVPHALPAKPVSAGPPARKVYSAAPQLRDLKKEAVKFMPAAVAAQKKRVKGEGRLLEPDEIDRLEKAGYYAAQKATEEAGLESRLEQVSSEVRAESGDVDVDEEARRFEEEIGQMYPEEAEKMPRGVAMEEVEDEGD